MNSVSTDKREAAHRWPELKMAIAVGALLLQSATALVWAGSAAQRISHLENASQTRAQIMERTARLEAQVDAIHAAVDRIERKLDQGGR